MTRSKAAVVTSPGSIFNLSGRALRRTGSRQWGIVAALIAGAAFSAGAVIAAPGPSTGALPAASAAGHAADTGHTAVTSHAADTGHTAVTSQSAATDQPSASIVEAAMIGNPDDPVPSPLPPAISSEEAQIGKEGYKEVEQEYNFVKDTQKLAQMQEIVNTLEKGTPYPNIHYVVNIVQAKQPGPDPDVNAFSLPGGYLFATKDLVDDCQSVDELAAVLGHEMAHDVHHHVLRQMKQREHDTLVSLLPVLGALLVAGLHPNNANSEAAGNIAKMSQYVVQALQSPHSIADEHMADMSGIDYLYRTKKYNPVGMLTFMQRLDEEAKSRPEFDEGFLQTHPNPANRVEDIRNRLIALHVPLNTRAVTKALVAVADHVPASSHAVLRMRKLDICSFTDSVAGQDPYARAVAAANAINRALDRGLMAAELSDTNNGDSAAVLWAQQPIFEVTANDAAAVHEKPDDLARDAIKQIRQAVWDDELTRD